MKNTNSESPKGYKNILAILFVMGVFGCAFALKGIIGGSYEYITKGEVFETHFGSYEEIKTSGYFKKGWIPECLPGSICSINEAHDIDTNEVWMKFKFDINDQTPLRRIVLEIPVDNKIVVCGKSAPKWWPRTMPPNVKMYMLHKSSNCDYYHPKARFMIDWESGVVYMRS